MYALENGKLVTADDKIKELFAQRDEARSEVAKWKHAIIPFLAVHAEQESGKGLDGTPCSLFHVTTGRKAKLYRQTGRINAPVRGFDTLLAAMAWAMKTGRKVIMQVKPVSTPQMLPDHHNAWGRAWWTDSVPIERVKCAYSAEGAWPHPDSSANANGPVSGEAD